MDDARRCGTRASQGAGCRPRPGSQKRNQARPRVACASAPTLQSSYGLLVLRNVRGRPGHSAEQEYARRPHVLCQPCVLLRTPAMNWLKQCVEPNSILRFSLLQREPNWLQIGTRSLLVLLLGCLFGFAMRCVACSGVTWRLAWLQASPRSPQPTAHSPRRAGVAAGAVGPACRPRPLHFWLG